MTRSIKDNTSRKGNLCNPFVSSLYTAYIPERAFPIVGECSVHMKKFFVQISLSPHPCILPLRSIHSAAFFLRNNNPAEYGTILIQKQRAIFTDPLQRQYALQRHTREKTVLTIEPARLIQEPLDYNKKKNLNASGAPLC